MANIMDRLVFLKAQILQRFCCFCSRKQSRKRQTRRREQQQVCRQITDLSKLSPDHNFSLTEKPSIASTVEVRVHLILANCCQISLSVSPSCAFTCLFNSSILPVLLLCSHFWKKKKKQKLNIDALVSPPANWLMY